MNYISSCAEFETPRVGGLSSSPRSLQAPSSGREHARRASVVLIILWPIQPMAVSNIISKLLMKTCTFHDACASQSHCKASYKHSSDVKDPQSKMGQRAQ